MLTEEMVFMRTKCNRLDLIKNLNLWGNNLQDISVLQGMPNLEVLSLSVNQVNTLADLQHCPKLSELYLRKNEIGDLTEVLYLKNLRHMRVLWLADNPCATVPHYREFILHHLPSLVKLDSRDVTDEERRHAQGLDFGRMPAGHSQDGDSEPGDEEVVEPGWEPHERHSDMGGVAADPRMARRGNSFESDAAERMMGMPPGDPRDPRMLRRGSSFEADIPERFLPPRGSSANFEPDGLDRSTGSMAWSSAHPMDAMPEHPGRRFVATPESNVEEEAVSVRASHPGEERALNRRPSGRYPEVPPFADEYPVTPSSCGTPAVGRQSYGSAADWAAERPLPRGDGSARQQAWATASRSPPSPESPGGPPTWSGGTRASASAGAGVWGAGAGPRGSQRSDGRRSLGPEAAADAHQQRLLQQDRGDFRGEPQRRGEADPRLDPRIDPRLDPYGAAAAEAVNQRSGRADNILCAVLALIKELDAQGLELVRRAVEQRGSEV